MNWLWQNETGCHTFPRDKNSSETILLLIYPNSVSASDSQRRLDHIAETRVFFRLLHKARPPARVLATDLKKTQSSPSISCRKNTGARGRRPWKRISPDRTEPGGSRRLRPPGIPGLPKGHRALPDSASLPTPPPSPAPRGRRSRRPRHLPAPGRGKEHLPLTLRRAGSGRAPSGRAARSTTAPSSSPWHPAGGNGSCCLPGGLRPPGPRGGAAADPREQRAGRASWLRRGGRRSPRTGAGTAPGTGIISGHISPPLAATVPARQIPPQNRLPPGRGRGISPRQPAFERRGNARAG